MLVLKVKREKWFFLPWTVDAALWAAATVVFFASTALVAITSAAAEALFSALVNNSLAFAKIFRRIKIFISEEKKQWFLPCALWAVSTTLFWALVASCPVAALTFDAASDANSSPCLAFSVTIAAPVANACWVASRTPAPFAFASDAFSLRTCFASSAFCSPN